MSSFNDSYWTTEQQFGSPEPIYPPPLTDYSLTPYDNGQYAFGMTPNSYTQEPRTASYGANFHALEQYPWPSMVPSEDLAETPRVEAEDVALKHEENGLPSPPLSVASPKRKRAQVSKTKTTKSARRKLNDPRTVIKLEEAHTQLVKLRTEELAGMEAWVHRSAEMRREEVRIKGYTPRPRNSFILFRTDYIRRAFGVLGPDANHQMVSQLLGSVWNQESQVIKRKYDALAKVDADNHRRTFPDYKFKPKKSRAVVEGGVPSRKPQKQIRGKAQTSAKRLRAQPALDTTPILPLPNTVLSQTRELLPLTSAQTAPDRHGVNAFGGHVETCPIFDPRPADDSRVPYDLEHTGFFMDPQLQFYDGSFEYDDAPALDPSLDLLPSLAAGYLDDDSLEGYGPYSP